VVRRAYEFALFLALLAACAACTGKPHGHAAAVSSARPEAHLAALSASSWLVDLDVPGFGSAKLAVPSGATEPRPIVIALHGIADRPEWACGAYRGIVGSRPFVLCPRGVQRADLGASAARYTFGNADDTARELRAALTALKSKYGAYVAPGSVILGGLELGADHAARIALQEPSFFSRLVLVGVSEAAWSSSVASLFGRQGGEVVLFASGPAQQSEAVWQAQLTHRAGAIARAIALPSDPADLGPGSVARLSLERGLLEGSKASLATIQNQKGNALPLGGPVLGRPAP
jgi:hypothetical protein